MVWLNDPHSLWPAFGLLRREMARLSDRTTRSAGLALNLSTTADEALLVARVPGVESDAIDLSVEGRVLTLSITEGDSTTRRAVRLPWPADTDAITASLTHGRLTVRVPRLAADRPRRIEITTTPNA